MQLAGCELIESILSSFITSPNLLYKTWSSKPVVSPKNQLWASQLITNHKKIKQIHTLAEWKTEESRFVSFVVHMHIIHPNIGVACHWPHHTAESTSHMGIHFDSLWGLTHHFYITIKWKWMTFPQTTALRGPDLLLFLFLFCFFSSYFFFFFLYPRLIFSRGYVCTSPIEERSRVLQEKSRASAIHERRKKWAREGRSWTHTHRGSNWRPTRTQNERYDMFWQTPVWNIICNQQHKAS